jgi:serine/threonine protein kinase/tetratricopeptide (TPR) repeat protein/TolB-like protein
LLWWSRGIYCATHRRHSPAFLDAAAAHLRIGVASNMGERGPLDLLTDSSVSSAGNPSLTPQRWQQIKELFSLALEHEPGQRNTFLQEACDGDEALRKEVESLLASAGGDGAATSALFKAVSPQPPEAPPSEAEDPMLGRRIGDYRIDRRIGYGGMAAVYLASRADEQFQMRVAVKLLRPDLDHAELLRRFLNERQTLAALGHPNIVKLLDGGSTEEGLPYLVMDYVEGSPIDEYCDTHSLSIQERLHLFCKVCEAVEHAHQHRVIHRDLKPNNILMTVDGTPKLLDFGIAKVLNPSDASEVVITRTASRHLTPAYASPEQVRGEPVTTATDVYSLGVVLYGLLTGHRPYRLEQRTPAAMERAICEQEPESPSTAVDRVETETLPDGTTVTVTAKTVSRTREGQPDKLRHSLKGDLDNIVLKALQKDPQRRYRSVAEFAQDIQRQLEHLPIQARPSTFTYRASKFVRRRKTEAIAGAAVVLVLLAAVVFSVLEERQAAERARAELVSQRARGRRSVAVLGFKNLSARADTAWLSTALSEMLTTELSAGGKLRTIPGENVAQTKINLSLPEAESLSGETLNRVYKNLGSDFVIVGSYLDVGDPGRNVRLDLRVQDAALGETVATLAETGSETSLPDLVTRVGANLREKLGVSGISQAEAASVQASLPSNPATARLYAEGLAQLRVFDAAAARDLLEKAVVADPNYALAHSALADAWSYLGYGEKARDEAKKALDRAGNLPREHILWVRGRSYQMAGDADKATEVYHALFEFFPDNLDYGLRLAESQTDAGKLDEAMSTIDALRKLPAPVGEDPRIDLAEADTAQSHQDYKREAEAATRAVQKGNAQGARLLVAEALGTEAHAYRNMNDLEKSKNLFLESRQLFAAAGNRNGEARVLGNVAIMLARQGDLDNAKKSFQEALQIRHELGNKSGEASSLTGIANVLLFQRDLAGAVDAYQRALALYREVGGTREIALTLHNLGNAEKDRGHLARAKDYLQQALPSARHFGDKSLMAGCLINLAHVYAAQGDVAGAVRSAQESLATLRTTSSKAGIRDVAVELGDFELLAGDLTAAHKLYSEAAAMSTGAGQDFAASYSLFGFGDILMAQGDLASARKQHEAALASRQKEHGYARELFDSRVRLAELSAEEGHASDAEQGIRHAFTEYAAQNEPAAQIEADAILVRSLLAQSKLPEAQQVVSHDRELMANSEDRFSRVTADIANAQVQSAGGRTADAIKSLDVSAREAKHDGFVALQFEARLALGEALSTAGNSAAARAQFLSLERDAKAKGFLLIAHKARTARSEH